MGSQPSGAGSPGKVKAEGPALLRPGSVPPPLISKASWELRSDSGQAIPTPWSRMPFQWLSTTWEWMATGPTGVRVLGPRIWHGPIRSSSENGDLIVLCGVPPWATEKLPNETLHGRLHIKESAQARIHLSCCVSRTPCHWPDLRLAAGSLSFLQAPVNDICLSPPVPANYKEFLARSAALGHRESLRPPTALPGLSPAATPWPSQHLPAFEIPPRDDSTNWTRRPRPNRRTRRHKGKRLPERRE